MTQFENHYLIPAIEVTKEISAGEIVLISQSVSGYEIETLIETEA